MNTGYVRMGVLLVLFVVLAVSAVAQGIAVIYNGTPLKTTAPPVERNGRVLAGLRDIFEALGAKIRWDSVSRTVTATQGSTVVVITINSNVAYVDGRAVTLDVPAQIINEYTYVPLRFVAEATGAQVQWIAATRTVTVTTGAGRGMPPQHATNNSIPAPAIISPRPNAKVGPAVDVVGRTVPGSTIRIITYVYKKDTGEQIARVPGIVHNVAGNGEFSHRIAIPTHRDLRPSDLYYDIHCWTVMEGGQSQPTVIRVYRD
ncbi:MAG: copper amine oxidase N-terminal domain-containing protein [Candidatus Zipacnadales bacterium]